jgi:hypothetical protein
MCERQTVLLQNWASSAGKRTVASGKGVEGEVSAGGGLKSGKTEGFAARSAPPTLKKEKSGRDRSRPSRDRTETEGAWDKCCPCSFFFTDSICPCDCARLIAER